eukprot:jgi/Mesvir1/11932/Mv00268-RA.1
MTFTDAALQNIDPAFYGAGKTEGLMIWRMENFAPKPLEEPLYGRFSTGDSYIVLHTTIEKKKAHNIHFWLGEESTADEKGTAALKTVELDMYLGGHAIQHRQVQGHESAEFLSLFKSGIEYVEGGVDSSFKRGEKIIPQRLLHCKGKRNIRVLEVPMTRASLNLGDVFLLDNGRETIYQWNGRQANSNEKSKGVATAKRLRDTVHGGKATITIIDDFEGVDTSGYKEFWDLLGGYGPISAAEEGGDDWDADVVSHLRLFSVKADGSSFTLAEVEERPLHKDMLKSDQSFILDTGDELLVWTGAECSQDQRASAMKMAMDFLDKESRPSWTPVTRVLQGHENLAFTSKFKWPIPPPTKAALRDKEHMSDAELQELAKGQSEAAELARKEQSTFVDDGKGELKVWRVQDFTKVEVDPSEHGKFYTGDSYLVLYKYKTDFAQFRYLLFFWLGRNSSQDEKGSCAWLAKELDDELCGKATQIRVIQGKEPAQFMFIFQGRMVVLKGGYPSGFQATGHLTADEGETYTGASTALFHVKGSHELNTRAIQVDLEGSSLDGQDCFVLQTPDKFFVWNGKGSMDVERSVAAKIPEKLRPGSPVTVVLEGEEPEEFWELLGGRAPYLSVGDADELPREPRLFQCHDEKGVFKLREIFNFAQDDLDTGDVMILDAYTEIYVWQGRHAREDEKRLGLDAAKKYLAAVSSVDGRSPDDTTMMLVPEGEEPPMFTRYFLGWQWNATGFVDPYQKRLQELNQQQRGVVGEEVSAILSRMSSARSDQMEQLLGGGTTGTASASGGDRPADLPRPPSRAGSIVAKEKQAALQAAAAAAAAATPADDLLPSLMDLSVGDAAPAGGVTPQPASKEAGNILDLMDAGPEETAAAAAATPEPLARAGSLKKEDPPTITTPARSTAAATPTPASSAAKPPVGASPISRAGSLKPMDPNVKPGVPASAASATEGINSLQRTVSSLRHVEASSAAPTNVTLPPVSLKHVDHAVGEAGAAATGGSPARTASGHVTLPSFTLKKVTPPPDLKAAADGSAAAAAPAPAPAEAAPAEPPKPAVEYAPIVPGSYAYEQLKTGQFPAEVDPSKREAYLSDAEFVQHLGASREDFYKQPKWKQDAKKKAAKLW